MCGLTGWMMPEGSTWRPSKKLIEFWLKGVESRGRMATGYFTLTDEETPRRFWMKGPISATAFVVDINADTTPVGRIGLMHTRSATVGSPQFNKNNHPIVVGKTVVTHNGGFPDYKKVYEKLGVTEPVGDVDSAIIPHALDLLGIKDGLKVITEETAGLAAIVGVMPNLDIVMAKDGRPLYLGRLPEGGRMWSSEAEVCFATPDWEEDVVWEAMRFPSFKYVVFDGHTLRIKDTGGFLLRTPTHVNASHASGMGVTDYPGFKGQSNTTHEAKSATRSKRITICAWGRCCDPGTKTISDTDGKQKMVCKPHKRMWRRGSPVPSFRDHVISEG